MNFTNFSIALTLGIEYDTESMIEPSIVIDTNVIVSALRSQLGASNRLLQLVGTELFTINLSIPIVLEYEEVLLRQLPFLFIDEQEVTTLINYLCNVAVHRNIFFLWRPILRDPDDEMVLELAANSGCSHIVTHNIRDLREAKQFGVKVVTPKQFLTEIGVSK